MCFYVASLGTSSLEPVGRGFAPAESNRIRRGQLRHIGSGEGRKFGNGMEDTVGTPLEVNCPEGKRDHPGVPGVSDPSHNVM